MIKEISRRVAHRNVYAALYTIAYEITHPVSTSTFWHRALRPKKLVEAGFMALGPRMTMARLERLYRVHPTLKTPGLRQLTLADVPSACALVNSYLTRLDFSVIFSEEEFRHVFISRDHVIQTHVLCNPSGAVTDLVSFFMVKSKVLNNPKHDSINVAYSFYHVATTCLLTELIEDALALAY
jgi:glycylpeptide N-tetradecanoyltransferase